ncbi:LCP family protein [uncultured Acetobacterium sp.]|uniref:LCP family protein n=1 Tax=uncultured Acetobacterium sp. TaxID=217139 RepID=UPI0025E0B6E9|nr:LCP family protein [uncultured Acetobacterium sp.]
MKNKKRLIIVIASIILIAAVLITIELVSGSTNLASLFTKTNNFVNTDGDAPQDQADLSLQDVLNKNNEDLLKLVDTRKQVVFALYGTDEKTEETGRSDIIMVIKYDPTEKKLIMVSLPRDTRVNVPGYGMDKINHAYAYGGRILSDQTIEALLGIKLDFSVNLDFETFSKIIDKVGGVSVVAKKDFYYNEDNSLAIKQGKQILNGRDALFYVRFRKDEDGDFGRIERQQEVIKSLMEALSSTSLKQRINLIESFYNNGLETDANVSKIKEYVSMSSGDANISYESYRLNTYSEIIGGLWYEIYNQGDLDTIKNLFSNQEAVDPENWK